MPRIKTLLTVWDKAFLAFVFLLPLVFNPWGFDMFEVTKTVYLRLGVSILGLWLIMDFFSKKTLRASRSVLGFSLIFSLILAIGLFGSEHLELSFWGTYYRQGGALSFLNFFALFLLTLHYFKDSPKEKLSVLMKCLSLSGLLMACYAIVQAFGFDIFPSSATDAFAGRSFSTLGNPTSLGTTLLFPLGAAFYSFQNCPQKMKWFYGLTLLALLAALILSRSRGALLGVAFVSGLYLLRFLRENKVRLLPLLFLVLLGGGIVLSTQVSGLRSVFSRFVIWESSLPIVLSSPIFGVGLENFSEHFEKTVLPEFFLYEDFDDLVDRPHNELLEVQMNFGILGSLAYLGAFLLLIRVFMTTRSSGMLWASASLLALFVANQFGFSLVTQSSLLFVFAAYLFAESPSETKRFKKMPALIFIGLSALFLTFNFFYALRLVMTDFHMNTASDLYLDAQIEEADFHLSKALSSSPQYGELYDFAYVLHMGVAKATHSDAYLHSAIAMNEASKEIFGSALQQRLHDAALFVVSGKTEEADAVYASIVENFAANPLVFLNWAELSFSQGNYEAAAEHYEDLLALLPPVWMDLEPYESDASRIFWKNHPDFLSVVHNLGYSYEMLGRESELTEFLGNLK